jgi:hypothetical protein
LPVPMIATVLSEMVTVLHLSCRGSRARCRPATTAQGLDVSTKSTDFNLNCQVLVGSDQEHQSGINAAGCLVIPNPGYDGADFREVMVCPGYLTVQHIA